MKKMAFLDPAFALNPLLVFHIILIFIFSLVLTDCAKENASKFEMYRLIDHLKSENIIESPYMESSKGSDEFLIEFPARSYALQDLGAGENPLTLKRKLKVGGREMNVIIAPPESRFGFDVSLGEDCILDFGIGIVRESISGHTPEKSSEAKGVNFMVVLEAKGRQRTVFQHYLASPPVEEKETVSFLRQRLDLPQADNIRLSLVTEGADNMSFWYNPVVFHKGTNSINVLLISVDTLRASHLGCYGYNRATSPHIDSLAGDSVLFENVYASSPWTLPSHVSMLTSLYGIHHQVYQDDERMDPAILTLADLLRKNNFFCTAFTGGGFVSSVYGFSKGFDMYEEGGGVHRQDAAELTNAVVSDWLDTHSADKNFFLFVHTYQPHDPYASPEPYKSMFLSPGARWRHINLMGFLGGKSGLFKPLTEEDRQNIVGLYDGEVRYTDEALIGPLIAKLKQLDLYDRTLVIFTSDHGEEFYDHKSWGHGHQLYDESLKVPLLIKFPGSRFRGERIATMVSLVDVMPTVLDVVGIDCSKLSLDGESLIPVIRGKETKNRSFLADIGDNVLNSHVPQKIATNDGADKFILNKRYTDEDLSFFQYPPPRTGPVELYDLKNDPEEKHNISDQKSTLVNQLVRKIEDVYRQIRKRKSLKPDIDEELREQLRALGYIK